MITVEQLRRKAKAYEEAIERARKIHNDTEFDYERGMMEEIFPELSESEDERIRKWIIENIQETLDVDGFFEGQKTMAKNAIVWLEKQGEQKPIETRTIGYWNVQEMITPEESLGISSEEWNKIVNDSIYGEPRITWSEEDERIYQSIIDDTVQENQLDNRQINWLKSLKERVQSQSQWKPSEEQLNNILDILSFDNCTPKRRELLESLYHDLKKLKGE